MRYKRIGRFELKLFRIGDSEHFDADFSIPALLRLIVPCVESAPSGSQPRESRAWLGRGRWAFPGEASGPSPICVLPGLVEGGGLRCFGKPPAVFAVLPQARARHPVCPLTHVLRSRSASWSMANSLAFCRFGWYRYRMNWRERCARDGSIVAAPAIIPVRSISGEAPEDQHWTRMPCRKQSRTSEH